MLRPHFQVIHPHPWFPEPQAAPLKLPGFPGIQQGGVLRAQPLTLLPLNDPGHQHPQKCQQDEAQEDGDQELKPLVFPWGRWAVVGGSEGGQERQRGERAVREEGGLRKHC